MERQLITDYEALIDELLPHLAAHNHAIAVELALDTRTHPRLRPREGSTPGGGEGERSRAGRVVSRGASCGNRHTGEGRSLDR